MGANRTREEGEAAKGPQEEQGTGQRQKLKNESGKGGGSNQECPRDLRSSRHRPQSDLTVQGRRQWSNGKGGWQKGGCGGAPEGGRSPR